MAAGNEYFFSITEGLQVEIARSDGSIALRLGPAPSGQPPPRRASPELVLSDDEGQALVVIRRVRRFPRARLALLRAGQPVGWMEPSLLKTCWAIEVSGGAKWWFHMPLYSSFFHAISSEAGGVVVRMLKESRWTLLFGLGHDSPELLGALAFVFRSRWMS
jgi:hypothetical protein